MPAGTTADAIAEGLEHIRTLREAAKAYDGTIPDMVVDAVAWGIVSAMAISDEHSIEAESALVIMLLSICNNCYAVGYVDGRADNIVE